MSTFSTNPLVNVSFPRTGKRGVPQQFPLRLYQMLEGEAKLEESTPGHQSSICWSESGTAFRIYDASRFSSEVLGKYFRTSKFSSFQRNLNLYGFTKIRRGPDADMYSHPNFVRGYPEMISQLRKCNSHAQRKRMLSSHFNISPELKPETSGTVSPSPPGSPVRFTEAPNRPTGSGGSMWHLGPSNVSVVSPFKTTKTHLPAEKPDTSRLDLLAKALLNLAEGS